MGENELDQALVKRVQRGDRAAFDLLVRKYQTRIAALVGRYIHDWSECQDVTQDTFVRAWKALANFRGDAQFYTWLYRIAVNTAKNHLVATNRRPPADDIDAEDAVNFGSADPCAISIHRSMSCCATKSSARFPIPWLRCPRNCA